MSLDSGQLAEPAAVVGCCSTADEAHLGPHPPITTSFSLSGRIVGPRFPPLIVHFIQNLLYFVHFGQFAAPEPGRPEPPHWLPEHARDEYLQPVRGMGLDVGPYSRPIGDRKSRTKNNPAESHIDGNPEQSDSSQHSSMPKFHEGTSGLGLGTPRSAQNPYAIGGRHKYKDANTGHPAGSQPPRLMPHDQGEKQNSGESDRGQQIADYKTLTLPLDSLLDLALAIGGCLRDTAPLFAPRIKFAVLSHGLSPTRPSAFSLPGSGALPHCFL